jgi:NAD(P)-dependent dehydrogenase (short-subunit alcohol dehydrogenase family)
LNGCISLTIIKKILRAPLYVVSFARALNQFRLKGGIVRAKIITVEASNLLFRKRILITGGSSGIGLAIARKFVSCGATVVITGRDENALREAVAEIGSDSLHYLCWDVADISVLEESLARARDLLGGDLDILVNNAGVLLQDPFLQVSEAKWDMTHAVNSKGLFFLTQSVCREWSRGERKIRKVLMVSSTSGFLPGAYPYRMSKWDLVGMTQGLALKLADRRIIVNGIAPGRTAGRMLGIGDGNIADPEIPLGRAALPEEIAELAAFLACDGSNYITGQTIICDGGMTLR